MKMATTNTNVFDSTKKFVDFAGLDYFWAQAKNYIDGVDSEIKSDITDIFAELETLSGGVGSVNSQIDAKIAALKLSETYETKGSAATVQGNLDTHIADSVAHVTVDERTAWNAAKTAIDTFLADADMTESAVDTLKELQSYMTSDGEAAAELVNRVAALEGIDHEAYKAADETVLASAKAYADGKDAAIEAAKNAAIADADAKLTLKANADNVYTKTEVDGLLTLKANADNVYTKTEVDGLLAANSEVDQAYAKAYTDALYDSIQFASNADIDNLFASGE